MHTEIRVRNTNNRYCHTLKWTGSVESVQYSTLCTFIAGSTQRIPGTTWYYCTDKHNIQEVYCYSMIRTPRIPIINIELGVLSTPVPTKKEYQYSRRIFGKFNSWGKPSFTGLSAPCRKRCLENGEPIFWRSPAVGSRQSPGARQRAYNERN